MIRRPPRSTQSRASAASDVYKRQVRLAKRRELIGRKRREDDVGQPRLRHGTHDDPITASRARKMARTGSDDHRSIPQATTNVIAARAATLASWRSTIS